jgi:hypothetical protein
MMPRQPSRWAVLAVRAVKTAVTSGLVATAVVVSLGGATASPADSPADAERVHTDARCSGAEGKTIVRTREGETRAVPFGRGWRIYRGDRPGSLVVVCPD